MRCLRGICPQAESEENDMPYAILEKEMEELDEAQQNAVVMFVRFLVSQKKDGVPSSFSYDKPRGRVSSRAGERTKKVPLFGALKDKIKFIASDFDEPLSDFAEYM